MKKNVFLLLSFLLLTPTIVLAWTKDSGPYDLIDDLQVSNQGVFYIANQYNYYNENYCLKELSIVNAKGEKSPLYDEVDLKVNDNNWGYSFNSYGTANGGYNIQGEYYYTSCNSQTNYGTFTNALTISDNSYLATKCTGGAEDERNPGGTMLATYDVLFNGQEVAKYAGDYSIIDMTVVDNKEAYVLLHNTGDENHGYYVIVGDKKYGLYKTVRHLQLSQDGKNFIFTYVDQKDKQVYVMYNNKVFGPYGEGCIYGDNTCSDNLTIIDLQVSNSHYGWIYQSGGTPDVPLYSAYIDGQVYGPFVNGSSMGHDGSYPRLTIGDKNWSLAYYTGEDFGNQDYFIVNGQVVQKYEAIVNSSHYGLYYYGVEHVDDDLIAYTKFTDYGADNYLVVNGQEFGPYPADYYFATDDGNWAIFDYDQVIFNGKKAYDFDRDSLFELDKANNEAYFGDINFIVKGNNWAIYKEAEFCNEVTYDPGSCMCEEGDWCDCAGCDYNNRDYEFAVIINGKKQSGKLLLPYSGSSVANDCVKYTYGYNGPIDEPVIFTMSDNYWAYQYLNADDGKIHVASGDIASWGGQNNQTSPTNNSKTKILDNNLSSRLSGKILLQVEQNGEAWYVYPVDKKRYYLGRPADAFQIMRQLGLGISEADYNNFHGYAPASLAGRILLRVEANGEAYYVNPDTLKMYYLGRPADAFNIMRSQGLGTSDNDLSKISD